MTKADLLLTYQHEWSAEIACSASWIPKLPLFPSTYKSWKRQKAAHFLVCKQQIKQINTIAVTNGVNGSNMW